MCDICILHPASASCTMCEFPGVHLVHNICWAQKPGSGRLLCLRDSSGICCVSGCCRSWNCETMVVDLCVMFASCILHPHPALCANSLPCTLCTICVGLRSQELWNSGTLELGTFLGLHLVQRVGLRSLARGLCCKADLCSSWNCEIMVVDRRRS